MSSEKTDESGTITVEELGKDLFKCAEHLRGNVDKGEYKDYILPLVFYAEVNRRFYNKYEDYLKEAGYTEDEDVNNLDVAIREVAEGDVVQGIRIPAGYSWEKFQDWEQFANNSEDDGVAVFIDDALSEFEEVNEAYSGVFEDSYENVSSFTGPEGDAVLGSLIDIVDEAIYESEKEIPPDMMGEAFMYLVKQFAEAEAGEYFTPPRVTELVVRLLEPFEPDASFHDPTAGSGGMLVEASEQIRQLRQENWFKNNEDEFEADIKESDNFRDFLKQNGFDFSGQELNPTISSIAKMNLAIHNIDGRIERGNSLTNPKFTEGDSLEEFDYILANFPFSESGWKTNTKDRASNYNDLDWTDSLPHGSYGDFAFIMHMHSHLADDGQLATVIPHGVLFRNGDQDYREYMIENDLVEAVIGLPESLFEATGIPSGILVLNNDKPKERKGEVMFFNADHEDRFYYDTGSSRTQLLEDGVDEIKSMFDDWDDEERVCRVVKTDEIEENEYNMNIALYVDTTEPQEDISVEDTLSTIHDLETEYESLNNQLTTYMQQLNYEGENDE